MTQPFIKTGVLLVNLGTPDAPDAASVRRYLAQFLSDRRVIELSPLVWQPLLRGVVLPLRCARVARNYQRIWNTKAAESPLLTHTRAQSVQLQARLDSAHLHVAMAMRYGRPSMAEVIDQLQARGCERLVVLPLYPQYSATTTASVCDEAFRILMRQRFQMSVVTVPPFAAHPLYISALAASVRSHATNDFQKLVISFHGLPQSYVSAGDPYETECHKTAEALSRALGLGAGEVALSYQSRFGRARWLEPSTSALVAGLPRQGIRRVAVISPGFMSDCIETLDELDRELKHDFERAGGESFCRVPCLNDSPGCIDLLEALVKAALQGG